MGHKIDDLKDFKVRAILETVQDAVVATDSHGVVLYMKEAATHFYGFRERAEEQLESLNLRRYVSDTFELSTLDGEPVPESEQPLTRALRGDAYRNTELIVRHRELDEVHVFVFSGRRVDADPPVSVLTMFDETDRWKAEQRYRTVFEADPAPSLVTRLEDEHIVQVNTGMQEMLESDESDIIGKKLTDLDLLSNNGGLPNTLDRLRAGERTHKHKTTLRQPSTGDSMHVLISARTIEIDGEACGLFTFSDITDLERSQREQIEMQDELAHATRRLAEQRERVLQAAAELRRTVRGLHPPALQELGLWSSLREALPEQDAGDLEIVFPKGRGPDLPEETLGVLYRVAREAIQNAIKHANATKVRVTLRRTRSEAVLQFQDDGDGFEMPERLSILQRDDHFGLFGMEQRVNVEGGKLEIESTPGQGTTVRCRLPLSNQASD